MAYPTTTTNANCPSNGRYCNRITGNLAIKTATEVVVLSDDTPGHGFDCVGDLSALCCGFSALGEDVVAEGVLTTIEAEDREGALHRQFYVRSARLCRVTSPTHATTNLGEIEYPSPYWP